MAGIQFTPSSPATTSRGPTTPGYTGFRGGGANAVKRIDASTGGFIGPHLPTSAVTGLDVSSDGVWASRQTQDQVLLFDSTTGALQKTLYN